MGKIQLIFLGKQKQPLYGRTDEDRENEKIKWYKIIPEGGYRVGDGFLTTTEEQYAFGCPRKMEVYKIHTFEEEDGFTLDNDLISLEDYINDYCMNLIEIYNEL